jgi:glutaredoxin
MTKPYKGLLFILLFAALSVWANETTNKSTAQNANPKWYSTDADGKPRIHLYFFGLKTCPHCREAKPFLPKLTESYPWLQLHQLELMGNRDNINLYIKMAKSLGKVAQSVPAFLFCEKMMVGYDGENTTGVLLKQQLKACYEQRAQRLNSMPQRKKVE